MSDAPQSPSTASPDAAGVRSVVLIGAPGAGKSTVGVMVARRLGVDFVDVDDVIEHRAGKPISEIFVDEGEAHFRRVERETTLELLRSGGVVSLGGGAVMDPEIRAALAGHDVVWLKVSITQATRRIGMNTLRPLLLGNVRSRLVALLKERTPLYEQCATLTIDTDGLKARQAARQVVEALTGRSDPSDADDQEFHD